MPFNVKLKQIDICDIVLGTVIIQRLHLNLFFAMEFYSKMVKPTR